MNGPRLLVPGRVEIVLLDDGSGLVERGILPDVAVSVPQQEDLGRVALVPLEAVDRSPWHDLDLEAHPSVAAQLGRVRWVLVDRASSAAAQEAGHDVLEVEGGRAGATWIPADGAKRAYDAPDPILWTRLLGEEPDGETVQRWAETGALQDRIVIAMTGGRVSLRDLELARWAAGLRPERLAQEEAALAEILERAGDQREAADALLATLDAAEGDEVAAPPYARAWRVEDPGFTLEDGDGVRVTGGAVEVPPATVWRLEGVQPWEPAATAARREATFADWHARIQETRKKGKRRELLVWGLIGGLLLLGLGVGLLGQLALSRAQPADTDTDTVEASSEAPAP